MAEVNNNAPAGHIRILYPTLRSHTGVRHLNHPPYPLQQRLMLSDLDPQLVRLELGIGRCSSMRDDREPLRLQVLDRFLNEESTILQHVDVQLRVLDGRDRTWFRVALLHL